MKEKLKNMIIDSIKRWCVEDIYTISLYVENVEDDPYKPTVILGYNTEVQYEKSLKDTDEVEARWNFAFWLQNQELLFGVEETEDDVKKWITDNHYPIYDDSTDLSDEQYDEIEEMMNAFIAVLISIVKEIHTEKILTHKYGKEIPIIIHELEYYDEIALQNIEANGDCLPDDFINFCKG